MNFLHDFLIVVAMFVIAGLAIGWDALVSEVKDRFWKAKLRFRVNRWKKVNR